jgi:hypothetical protein
MNGHLNMKKNRIMLCIFADSIIITTVKTIMFQVGIGV